VKRSIIIVCIMLFTLTGCSSLKDAAPSVSARAEERSVLIGDRIRYEIDVMAPEGMDFRLPDFKDGKLGEFEIKDKRRKAGRGSFGRNRTSYLFDINIFTTGDKSIPAVEVKYKDMGSGEWKSVKTREIPVKVGSLLPKGKAADDIRDIKAPIAYREINWFLVSGIFTALLIAAAFLWAYIRRRMRKPIKLPHETALEELEAMKGELSRTDDVKRYYVGVSDAVRNYIERTFELKAPEMTTEEFLNSLRDSRELSIDHKRLLREFLASCDLVKFAKYSPKPEEIESVFITAGNFIRETKVIFDHSTRATAFGRGPCSGSSRASERSERVEGRQG